jgi:hypothetical protein
MVESLLMLFDLDIIRHDLKEGRKSNLTTKIAVIADIHGK